MIEPWFLITGQSPVYGITVLLYDPQWKDDLTCGMFLAQREHVRDGVDCWIGEEHGTTFNVEPTHWMPAPERPE